MFNLNRSCKAIMPVLALMGLVGCTSMANMPPGAPLADVQAKYGQPSTVCPTPEGNQHMVWSTQPFGQYAWGTTVNPQGFTDSVVPVLTDQNFKKLATGSWTEDQVICEFGPPAEISRVGLPKSSHKVFSYRYRQSSVWNSLMHVYFDDYTGKVTRFHPGPDPIYEREHFGFM